MKNQLKRSIRYFRRHLDPEKEEQLKWMKTEIEEKVKKILNQTTCISGNKDGSPKKKMELVHLVEYFHQQYEALYSLYEDLRGEVKDNVSGGDDINPNSPSDSEMYFSADEVKNSETTGEVPDKQCGDNDPTMQDEDSESSGQMLDQVKELVGEAASLKGEKEALCAQKQLEEQVECKSNEAKQMEEKMSRLEAHVLELEAASKESESLQLREDTGKGYVSRISDLIAQTNNPQLDVDKLHLQKGELDGRLSCETEEMPSRVDGLMEEINTLQKELVSVNYQNAELESELKKKSAEGSECLQKIENLQKELKNRDLVEKSRMEEKERFKVQVKDLDLEVQSLSSNKNNLEEQITELSRGAYLSEAEKQELQGKISELQTSLSESKNELSAQQKKYEACQSELSAQIESLNEKVKKYKNTTKALQNERDALQMEMESLRNDKKQRQMELEKEREESLMRKSYMEKKNNEFTDKIAYQQKTMLELGDSINNLKAKNKRAQTRISECKSNFLLVERKMEEMAEEFHNQFEDKCRILSRRIRVAEQLQVEHKEWYLKTKEMCEQQNKELKEWIERSENVFVNVKDMSSTANDMLVSMDSVALKFEECTANFLNRISKASCELKFAKDWAMRKNKAIQHTKNDLDCLLSQLDDKEAEILAFREKLWKSENKVRELEKEIKEKEDGMVGLQEEKREAIRQLCVWIDYHKSRSDYYMKILSEKNPGHRKVT